MRRYHKSRKKRGIIEAGVVLGALLVFMNVNAAPLSAQDSPIKTGRLQTEASVAGENVTNINTKVNSLANFEYEQKVAELNVKITQQQKEMILNGNAAEAVQLCKKFYTAADFEALAQPKVRALAGANLYVSADETSAVVHSFESDDSVTMLYQCEGSNFYYVEYNGMYRGYMARAGLDVSILSTAQIQQASEVNRSRFAAVAMQELYLWAQPSEEAEVAAVVESGVIMEIVGIQDGYLKVSIAGSTGFVSADEVTVDRILTAEVDSEGYIKGVRAEMESQQQEESEQTEAEGETETENETEAEAEEQVEEESSYEEPAYEESSYEEEQEEESSYEELSYEESSYEEPEESDESSSTASSLGQAIADTALNYLGVPYVYGGASPSGFDCSGLVYYCAMLNGISIPHGATSQYYCGGTYVSYSDLAVGDLVFFSADWSSEIEHVGIYIGGGQFVHAPHTGDVVKISSLSGYYERNYWGALRLG